MQRYNTYYHKYYILSYHTTRFSIKRPRKIFPSVPPRGIGKRGRKNYRHFSNLTRQKK